jgi:hypothetical protein
VHYLFFVCEVYNNYIIGCDQVIISSLTSSFQLDINFDSVELLGLISHLIFALRYRFRFDLPYLFLFPINFDFGQFDSNSLDSRISTKPQKFNCIGWRPLIIPNHVRS